MHLSFSVLFILSTESGCPDPDHYFLSQKIHTNTRSDIIQNTTGYYSKWDRKASKETCDASYIKTTNNWKIPTSKKCINECTAALIS